MILPGRAPWVASAVLHAGLLVLGLVFLLQDHPAAPPPLRMRLVAPVTGSAGAPPSQATWLPPGRSLARPSEPQAPLWRGTTAPPAVLPSSRVPVSLDELLIASDPEASLPRETKPSGWAGPPGTGYGPPPLPPPALAPPQGARWTLTLSIGGGGGLARSIEGLNSGHPELDLWLEEYLRTVSFPSSPDGRDYDLRWSLSLEAGRPE